MTHIIDNITSEQMAALTAFRLTGVSQALSASTLTLSLNSNCTQIFTGATTGQIVKLPDATGLQLGHQYELQNAGTASLVVQDGSATAIVTLSGSSTSYLTLLANSTIAGLWSFWQIVNNSPFTIIHYNVTATALFSTTATAYSASTIVTSMTATPSAGTYVVWYNGLSAMSSGYKTHYYAIFKNGTIIANSERYQDSACATAGMIDSTITDVQVNGTDVVDVRVYLDTGTALSVTNRSLILIRIGN